jgi:2-dehydropantoate 2-reductase
LAADREGPSLRGVVTVKECASVRVLFLGAGAVGGYFGGRLVQAGRDVTFLVREHRARELAENGLRIQGPEGETERIPVRVTTAGRVGDPFDVVVIAVKAFALDSALDDLGAAVGPDTVLVPFLNGLRHIEVLRHRYDDRRTYGGVCYVATELRPDGTIIQLNGIQSLSYGPIAQGIDSRARAIQEALSGGGFPSELSATIIHDMWEKWIFLAGVGAATTLMRADLGQVNRAPGGGNFTSGLVDELIAIARASGFPPRDPAQGRLRATMSDRNAPLTSSMYRDLMAGNRLEAEHIIGDLVRRAEPLGLTAPRLQLVRTNLAVYEAARVS